MERRTFIGAGAFGALASAAAQTRAFDQFFCKDYAQLRRLSQSVKGSALCLEAIAAEHVPQLAILHETGSIGGQPCARRFLSLSGPWPPAPAIFELRTYRAPAGLQLAPLLERAGIRFVCDSPEGTYLIPFASLAARERAWSAAAADPEWVRAGRSAVLAEVAVYRAMRAGRPGSASLPECLRTP